MCEDAPCTGWSQGRGETTANVWIRSSLVWAEGAACIVCSQSRAEVVSCSSAWTAACLRWVSLRPLHAASTLAPGTAGVQLESLGVCARILVERWGRFCRVQTQYFLTPDSSQYPHLPGVCPLARTNWGPPPISICIKGVCMTDTWQLMVMVMTAILRTHEPGFCRNVCYLQTPLIHSSPCLCRQQ